MIYHSIIRNVYIKPFTLSAVLTTVQKVFMLGVVLCLGLPGLGWAQVNISGKPGLIYIPSAEVVADGTFSFGYGFNPSSYAIQYNKTNSESIYFLNLVLLPRLEVNINLLRPNGIAPRGSASFAAEGIGDRQIDVKYVAVTERKKRPSMAIILSEPFGVSSSLVTYALVATKHIPVTKLVNIAITAGAGSPYFVYRDESDANNFDIFSKFSWKDKRDKPYQYLSGLFGGLNLNFNKKGGLMLEWDSRHVNVGAYALLFKHWTVQAGLLNGDQVTASTSYAIPLLRKPKRP